MTAIRPPMPKNKFLRISLAQKLIVNGANIAQMSIAPNTYYRLYITFTQNSTTQNQLEVWEADGNSGTGAQDMQAILFANGNAYTYHIDFVSTFDQIKIKPNGAINCNITLVPFETE